MYFQSVTKHDLDLVYGNVFFSVVQLLQLAEIVHSVYIILVWTGMFKTCPECIKHDFRPCLWKSGYFCSSIAATCWKLSTVFLSSWFEQVCLKRVQIASNMILDLVCGKVVISVVQLLQLAENCPQCSYHQAWTVL